MSDRMNRTQERAEGHDEQKGYARLAHSELRAKGIGRFRDQAGREYWVSEQKLQIILPDQSEVHYNSESDSISIREANEPHFVGYEQFTGDFSPYVNAVGMAQTIGLSEDPGSMGEIVSSVSTGQGETAGQIGGLMQ